MADRFARTADRVAAKQDAAAAALAERVREFVLPRGDERALDVGTGAGALALALAPLVREVVGVDRVPELLALARERATAFGNVELVEGDATALPFPASSFDLAATMRTLHHVARPELVLAELTRVTRPGGRVLVVDQLGPRRPARGARRRPLRARPRPVPHPAPARDRPAPALRGERARAAPGALRRRAPRAGRVPRPRGLRGAGPGSGARPRPARPGDVSPPGSAGISWSGADPKGLAAMAYNRYNVRVRRRVPQGSALACARRRRGRARDADAGAGRDVRRRQRADRVHVRREHLHDQSGRNGATHESFVTGRLGSVLVVGRERDRLPLRHLPGGISVEQRRHDRRDDRRRRRLRRSRRSRSTAIASRTCAAATSSRPRRSAAARRRSRPPTRQAPTPIRPTRPTGRRSRTRRMTGRPVSTSGR